MTSQTPVRVSSEPTDADSARARGQKAQDAFRTISEVAEELNVPQHVLRFWETRFFQVRPLKRGGGRRYYRPEDVALIRKIHQLLYTEGYTIKGVQKLLKGVSKTDLLKEQGITPTAPILKTAIPAGAPANQDSPESAVLDNLSTKAGLSETQRTALQSALRELNEIKTLLKAA